MHFSPEVQKQSLESSCYVWAGGKRLCSLQFAPNSLEPAMFSRGTSMAMSLDSGDGSWISVVFQDLQDFWRDGQGPRQAAALMLGTWLAEDWNPLLLPAVGMGWEAAGAPGTGKSWPPGVKTGGRRLLCSMLLCGAVAGPSLQGPSGSLLASSARDDQD